MHVLSFNRSIYLYPAFLVSKLGILTDLTIKVMGKTRLWETTGQYLKLKRIQNHIVY